LPTAGATVTATVTCPTGTVLGGGALVTSTNGVASLQSSYPSSTTQWTAIATVGELGGAKNTSVTVTAYVLCS
jgi:hypothetical protein